jgi:ribonuclease P protein subunit RPR2
MLCMQPKIEQTAFERIKILIQNAVENYTTNHELSHKQALLARKLCMRNKIRMPYELKILFCKKCKSFIAPGINSTIRVGGPSKSVRVTCNFCGHTYRKIISQ